jgi:uncharacterized protein
MTAKKLFSGLLVVGIALILLLSGCSQPAPAPTSQPTSSSTAATTPAAKATATSATKQAAVAPDPSWPKAISVGAPQATGSNYIAGTSTAVMIQKYLGVDAASEVLGGSATVINAIGSKQIELGIAHASVSQEAYEGREAWVGKPITSVRILAGGPLSVASVAVMSDSPVKSLPDLKGKKVMYDNPANAYFTQYFNYLLEAYGMTTKDITPLQWTDQQQIADGLIAGTIQAGMCPDVILGNSPVWVELSKKKPIRFLDIPREKLEYVAKKLGPSAEIVVNKGGKYVGMDNDVLGVVQTSLTVIRKDLPESFAYRALKAFWDEHLAEYEGFHPTMKLRSAGTTIKIKDTIPFHPGAIKYYQEKGLWTPELQQMQERLLTRDK